MSASTVARPTENAAIGRTSTPVMPPAKVLLALHQRARSRKDRYGIVLLGCAAIRSTTQAAGRKVGE
jgi:hypothetical protein